MGELIPPPPIPEKAWGYLNLKQQQHKNKFKKPFGIRETILWERKKGGELHTEIWAKEKLPWVTAELNANSLAVRGTEGTKGRKHSSLSGENCPAPCEPHPEILGEILGLHIRNSKT